MSGLIDASLEEGFDISFDRPLRKCSVVDAQFTESFFVIQNKLRFDKYDCKENWHHPHERSCNYENEESYKSNELVIEWQRVVYFFDKLHGLIGMADDLKIELALKIQDANLTRYKLAISRYFG